ncbi:MAG: hypothetical protein MR416_11595, partial [Lachnospiraceae bacterium]|nr:hypothetical protein [Lachnospiraceae bacterium]
EENEKCRECNCQLTNFTPHLLVVNRRMCYDFSNTGETNTAGISRAEEERKGWKKNDIGG